MKITDELFEQYERMVYYLYSKLERTTFVVNNREDLIQEGFLAMLKGIESYEEYRTVSLSTYLFHSVKYAMYRYIRDNSEAYFWSDSEIKESDYKYLAEEDIQEDPEEFVTKLLEDYKYYLTEYKQKNKKIDLWLCRAQIILEEFLKNGKVTTREIEEKYYFSRTNVSNVLRDLRNVILLRQQEKLYKGDKQL